MNKLLAGAVAVGMLTCTTVFDDGVAGADTALIVPGTEPSPYGPLRSLYHFNPAMQPQIDENYYSPAAVRRVVPYPGSFWPVTEMGPSVLRIAASRLFAPVFTELLTVGEFSPVTGQKLPG
ncbi:hypothetical protein A5713_13375 [Mycobacterium sp. E2497]|nr:hypothetical protein A5713_13375 [Mycobacterium sp. E2497]